MKTSLCPSVFGAIAFLSSHSNISGTPLDQAEFAPQEAVKMAVYYAAHPREITLKRILQETPKKLSQSDCFDIGALRRCKYSVAEDNRSPGLQSVTVSSTTAGVSRGGSIVWQFSQTPCVTDETVAQLVGERNVAPALPPTVPQPFATSKPTSENRDYRVYQSKNWNQAATLNTVSSKCLETLTLNAQLPEE